MKYKGYEINTAFSCPRVKYQGRWRWFRNTNEAMFFIETLEAGESRLPRVRNSSHRKGGTR